MKCVHYDYVRIANVVYIYTLAPHKETNVYIDCSNGDGQGLTRMLGWHLVLRCVINPI